SIVDPIFAAVGAITFAYLRNRICAPRDMSASAATAFRDAIDKLLTSIY
ncbi:glutathione S-transferase, partial [Nostoc sp. CMAA1605]|nr:glutathione S-transferase [Nostoc sp. CMAA1605]